METRELTCVVCPAGCKITVTLEDGKVTERREYLVKPHKSVDYMNIQLEISMLHILKPKKNKMKKNKMKKWTPWKTH